MPVQTVPVNAAYASHTGAHNAFRGMNAPTATQAADCATEMAAYINDLAVSRLKQCAGTAFRTWAFVGMSAFVTRMALPFIPLMSKVGAMASKASSTPSEGVVGANSGSSAIMNVDAGLLLARGAAARVASIGPWRSARADVERIANMNLRGESRRGGAIEGVQVFGALRHCVAHHRRGGAMILLTAACSLPALLAVARAPGPVSPLAPAAARSHSLSVLPPQCYPRAARVPRCTVSCSALALPATQNENDAVRGSTRALLGLAAAILSLALLHRLAPPLLLAAGVSTSMPPIALRPGIFAAVLFGGATRGTLKASARAVPASAMSREFDAAYRELQAAEVVRVTAARRTLVGHVSAWSPDGMSHRALRPDGGRGRVLLQQFRSASGGERSVMSEALQGCISAAETDLQLAGAAGVEMGVLREAQFAIVEMGMVMDAMDRLAIVEMQTARDAMDQMLAM